MRKKVNVAVHPLFWVLGVYFCFTGKLISFLLLSLAALEHETAHAFAAERFGYTLDKVVLMPFGAVVKGDIAGVTLKEEAFIALFGPAVSGLTACLFACLWWFFPETYPFTDGAFYACLSLCLVNLLPAVPLDGGRVLYCALARFLPKTRAWVACKVVSILFALGMVGLFFVSVWHGQVNVLLLFFALFLLFGVFSGEKRAYKRLRYDLSPSDGSELGVRLLAVGKAYPLKKCFSLLAERKYTVLLVVENGKTVAVLERDALVRWAETGNYTDTVQDFLEKEQNIPKTS